MLSWQDMYTTFQDLASDDNSSNLTVGKRFINQGVRKVQVLVGKFYNEEQRSITTVTDAISGSSDQAYYLPENFSKLVEFYVTVGTTQYRADLIQDYELWRQINSTTTQSESNFVQFVFLKNDRIELYPIPSSANTATIRYEVIDKDLTQDDYTDGNITTLANGGTAITGSSTTFTAAMVGRYFKINADGQWYKIATFTSTTSIALARKYQGSAIAAGSSAYTIGQFANLPPDCFELPVYYAVWRWALFRKDVQIAREYERLWKEGLRDAQSAWANLSNSNIVHDRSKIARGGIINPNLYPLNMS